MAGLGHNGCGSDHVAGLRRGFRSLRAHSRHPPHRCARLRAGACRACSRHHCAPRGTASAAGDHGLRSTHHRHGTARCRRTFGARSPPRILHAQDGTAPRRCSRRTPPSCAERPCPRGGSRRSSDPTQPHRRCAARAAPASRRGNPHARKPLHSTPCGHPSDPHAGKPRHPAHSGHSCHLHTGNSQRGCHHPLFARLRRGIGKLESSIWQQIHTHG